MHLVVIQHGVWGEPTNTAYLTGLLTERLGKTGYVLNFAGNSKLATYDGIDACGERLFQAVKATHDNLVHGGRPPTHISLIGYSMGGLITRYAAGRLFSEGYFDHVAPLNFVTIATPHLGSWRAPDGAVARFLNATTPSSLSRAGAQLYLNDTTPWGAPLLCVLTHPGLHFMGALRTFKNIVAMANVRYDRTVSFCSAAMQLDEPYPLRGFDAAVAPVDPSYKSVVRARNPGDSPARRRLRGRFLLTLTLLLAVVFFPLVLLMPLLMLLHGRLHSRRPSTLAADAALKEVYEALGGAAFSSSGHGNGGGVGVGGGGGGGSQKRLSTDSPSPGRQADPLQGRAVIVDVEIGLGARSCGGGGGGSPRLKGSPEDRLPLHKDHLRQQLSQGGHHLFAGLPPTTDKRAVQEWLVSQLAALPVSKVHVDTRDVFDAHSAIIVWNWLFRHCRDAMQYLVDYCLVWQ